MDNETQNRSTEKSTNWFAVILIALLMLGLGAMAGYLYRDNQAQNNANEAIEQGQQNIQDNIDSRNEKRQEVQEEIPAAPEAPAAPVDDNKADDTSTNRAPGDTQE